jgi:hypothetical protein
MSDAASRGPLRFGILLRVVATVAALALWFWTQSLIGSRAPSQGIGDVLHNLFGGLNSYFGQHASAANALLIVSSAFIDLFGLFLVAEWIFQGRSRGISGLGSAPWPPAGHAGALRFATAAQHALALPGISFAVRHLQRGQRLFLLRPYGDCGFRCRGTGKATPPLADRVRALCSRI